MLRSIRKDPPLVVALDIGSTYSGYACQWRDRFLDSPSDIFVNTNWGMGSIELPKTATCLLLDENGYVDSFGFKAERRYFEFCGQEQQGIQNKWHFFKGFKMLLYSETFKEEVKIDDAEGVVFSFKEVLTKFIKALRKDCLDKLQQRQNTVPESSIVWVLTVPAIWTEPAKKFMRDAGEGSGIKRENLILALEPEAAAIHCMYLSVQEREGMAELGKVGDKFLVVDLGGGTVDITAVEVLKDGMLKEITAANGGPWGANNVNVAFFEMVRDLFPRKTWEDISRKCQEDLFDMELDFETSKIKIGQEATPRDEWIALKIPREMEDKLKDALKPTQGASSQPDLGDMVDTKKGRFRFKSELIRERFFGVTTDQIITHLKRILKEDQLKGVDKIVLVGGFAESPIVIDAVKEMLSGKKVFVPTSPFYAVMRGAVLYGHNPNIFRSRISRFTYGVETNELFQPGKHAKDKKWKAESGEFYCQEIFDIHVKRGQTVALDSKQPKMTYNPMRKDQTVVSLPVYQSTSVSPQYTTDKGCTKLGVLKVQMPDTRGGINREVEVTMIYGGTELGVEAIDKTTGKEYTAEFDFYP